MSLGSIVVRLTMNTADFETDSKRAASIAEKRAKEIDASFRKAGVAIGATLGAAALVGVAGLKKYIQNTIEAEKVQAQLGARIKDTFGAAGRSIEQLNAQADKLQGITIFDDEAIGSAQAMLLTFKQVQGLQFDKAIESALDLATVMGTDATDSAKLLGKALADPEKGMSALSRAGVVFTDAERDAIKAMVDAGDVASAQDRILDKLQGTMGSAAEMARSTLGGAIQGLSNDFDNLLEGDANSGGLKATVDALNDFSSTINDPAIKSGIDTVASGVLDIAAGAIKAIAKLGELGGAIADVYGDVDKRSRTVLQNQRDDLEGQLFAEQRAQRRSWLGPAAAENAPAVKELKAKIAEIDRALANMNQPARNRFDPGYEARSLNFNPNPKPDKPATPAGGRSGTRSRALPDYTKEDRDNLAELVKQTAAADEAFKRMAATLGGPLAEAEYEHQENLKRITELGLQGEESTQEIVRLKELETQRYQEETQAIEDRLNPAQGLIKSMEDELRLLQLTGAEREREIALRQAGANATQEQIDRIAELNQQTQAAQKENEFWDNTQRQLAQSIGDVVTGSKSAKDAAVDFFDSIGEYITRMIAEDWAKQIVDLFRGGSGGGASGGSGGGLFSWLGALFGGSGGASASSGQAVVNAFDGFMGAGWASGGWTGPGGANQPAGIVHRGEVVWSQTDVARAGGVAAVEAMRRGGSGGRTMAPITVNIGAPREIASRRTQSQLAQEAGLAVRRAMGRN